MTRLDAFVASGSTYSYLSGTGFYNVAVGFATVNAMAGSGQSIAYFLDSAGTDTFCGADSYSYLSGNGYFDVASGFAMVYGQTFVGGTDFAYNYAPWRNVLGGSWVRLA